ncbi:MAG: hypothetical protein PQJ28_00790 [Spirochaetales bacterium]|nr:hypothetical protein [Spirochaetales bacterium]
MPNPQILITFAVLALACAIARYPLKSLPSQITCPLCDRQIGPVRHLQGGLFILTLTCYYLIVSILDLPPVDYTTWDGWLYVSARPEIITCLVFIFIAYRELVTPHHDYVCKKCRATWRMRDGELLGTHNSFTGFYHFFPF